MQGTLNVDAVAAFNQWTRDLLALGDKGGGKWWYTSRLTYSYDGIIRFAKNQLVLGTREGVVFSAFMHHLALFYLCPPAHWGTTPAYISYRSYKSFKSRYSPSYIPVIQCIYIYIIYGDKKIQSVWKSFPPPPRKEKTCKKIYNYFCNPSSLLKPTNSTLYLMNGRQTVYANGSHLGPVD